MTFLDPDILNGLAWSGNLDEIFRENAEKFPVIYWQSFASNEGYMRMFPAARYITLSHQRSTNLHFV